jgi:hypothetical protein
LAREQQAPAFLAKHYFAGVPYIPLLLTACFGALAFIDLPHVAFGFEVSGSQRPFLYLDFSTLIFHDLYRYCTLLGCDMCNLSAFQTWYQCTKAQEHIRRKRQLPSSALSGLVWTGNVSDLW